MVIAIFGESCTGKSTIAEAMRDRATVEIFSGKDYLRLAKSEAAAEKLFTDMLNEGTKKQGCLIYVISEKEHMKLIPEGAIRVLVTADIAVIKERFAKRMHGNLPSAIAAALEKKHGSFDGFPCNIHVKDGEKSVEGICDELLSFIL